MTIKFSPEMNNVLNFSKEEAGRLHNDSVTPVHLLLAILRHNDNKARDILARLQPDLVYLKQELETSAKKRQVLIAPAPIDMNFDTQASRIMRFCVLEARMLKSETIDPEHVLLAILKASGTEACSILEGMDITYKSVAKEVASHNSPSSDSSPRGMEGSDSSYDDDDEYEDDGMTATAGHSGSESTMTAQPKKKVAGKTPVLDSFGTDLTKAAAEGLLDPVVGRSREIERVTQILSRRKKNNPILIGQPGVGKSAIVEGLALRIVQHRTSRQLWTKRVVTLDMANVVAGTKYRGQFEERLRNIMAELKKNPDVIVFIDEVHTIIGAGSAQGTMDAANMLKPALSRGEFQCIGATTTDEFRKTIEKDGALDRRFQKVLVEPTTAEETLQILTNLKDRYEEHHHVHYTDEALKACVTLTERYVPGRCFPDKAIDAMDEAGSRVRMQDTPIPADIQELEGRLQDLQQKKNEAVKKQNFELAADFRDQARQIEQLLAEAQQRWEASMGDKREVVDENFVAEVVSMMTGIPVQRIGQEESQRLRSLKDTLQKRVIGQDNAISTLVRAIQRSRLGLKDPQKPIGAFLFVGPTGVGKTYLTKCLAEELFGSADSIIRIDMSEYMEKHTVSRMVGAPPGYVGYEEGGQLTEKVRRKPYSIVLLDEIEKAHQDVFNMLLQVMDEGRLTDGNGSTIDFKNTIVIMTSNCGTKQLRDFGHGVGFQTGEAMNNQMNHDIVKKALQKQFAPEFLNRLDDIIYFDQLSQESIQNIVDIELRPLIRRLNDMGFNLHVSEEARRVLGKRGYDVQYGARPLKRAIQNLLEDPLCEVLMTSPHNSSSKGTGRELMAEAEEDKIVITKG